MVRQCQFYHAQYYNINNLYHCWDDGLTKAANVIHHCSTVKAWKRHTLLFLRHLTGKGKHYRLHSYRWCESKKEGKYQESIQSSTTPDPGYQWESYNVTVRHTSQTNESQEVSHFPTGDHKASTNRHA